MADEFKRMRQMVGSEADWAANDLVLGNGEIAVSIVDGVYNFKIGNGVDTFSAINYEMVTLSTEQTILGQKTFNDDVLFLNRNDPTSYGHIYSADIFGQHSLIIDSNEISSNAILMGRDETGETFSIAARFDGTMWANTVQICDRVGINTGSIASFRGGVNVYLSSDANGGDLANDKTLIDTVRGFDGVTRYQVYCGVNLSAANFAVTDLSGVLHNFEMSSQGFMIVPRGTLAGDPDFAVTTKDYVDTGAAATSASIDAHEAIVNALVAENTELRARSGMLALAVGEALGATPAQMAEIQAAIDS